MRRCDLVGNVWEWVEDEFCDFGRLSADGRPAACGSEDRVRRGGGFIHPAEYLHAKHSLYSDAARWRSHDLGFRVCR